MNLFCQTFLAQRFLKQKDIKQPNDPLVKSLVSHNDYNGNESAAANMISTLPNTELSKYMDNLTNLDDQGYKQHESAIELLMKNIILEYPQDCEQLTSSSNTEYAELHPNQHSVFNQNDMFSIILRFLEFESLIACSLVDSNWLINSFNVNYIYFLSLNELFKANEPRPWVWKRLYSAKHIKVTMDDIVDTFDASLRQNCLKHLPLFSMIEKIDLEIERYTNNQIFELIKLLNAFDSKLKSFVFRAEESDPDDWDKDWKLTKFTSLAPIHLLNCVTVDVDGILFPIIISNKCEHLTLKFECAIDYTSKYCDLSGVRYLKLAWLTLMDLNKIKLTNNNRCHEMLDQDIDKLCQTLSTNIRHLVIHGLTHSSLRLWTAIHNQRIKGGNYNYKNITDDDELIMNVSMGVDDDLIDQIVRDKLTMSQLRLTCRFNSRERTIGSIKLLDYVLNINDETNINGNGGLKVLSLAIKLNDVILEAIINSFNQLIKTNSSNKQLEKVMNQLQIIEMCFQSYRFVSPSAIETSLITQWLEIFEKINIVKMTMNKNSKNKNKDTDEFSLCSFFGIFKIAINDLNNENLIKMLLNKIKDLMKQQMPISIEIGWYGESIDSDSQSFKNINEYAFNQVKVFDQIFPVETKDETPKWYQEPLCHQQSQYVVAEECPVIRVDNDNYVIKLSNCCNIYFSGI